jgi:hypothetical protein
MYTSHALFIIKSSAFHSYAVFVCFARFSHLFGYKELKRQENRENYILRSFIIFASIKILFGDFLHYQIVSFARNTPLRTVSE